MSVSVNEEDGYFPPLLKVWAGAIATSPLSMPVVDGVGVTVDTTRDLAERAIRDICMITR